MVEGNFAGIAACRTVAAPDWIIQTIRAILGQTILRFILTYSRFIHEIPTVRPNLRMGRLNIAIISLIRIRRCARPFIGIFNPKNLP